MTTIRIKLPTIEEVGFKIEPEEEDIAVVGYYTDLNPDEPERMEAMENEVVDQLTAGNVWAWCYVKITATWRGLEGSDGLGCCSYKSEEDFIKNSGYYEEKKEDAYNDLIEQLKALKG